MFCYRDYQLTTRIKNHANVHVLVHMLHYTVYFWSIIPDLVGVTHKDKVIHCYCVLENDCVCCEELCSYVKACG